jgi:hypothetical protein
MSRRRSVVLYVCPRCKHPVNAAHSWANCMAWIARLAIRARRRARYAERAP